MKYFFRYVLILLYVIFFGVQSYFINTESAGLPVSLSSSCLLHITPVSRRSSEKIAQAPVNKKSGLRLNKRFRIIGIPCEIASASADYPGFYIIKKDSPYFSIYANPVLIILEPLRGPPVVA